MFQTIFKATLFVIIATCAYLYGDEGKNSSTPKPTPSKSNPSTEGGGANYQELVQPADTKSASKARDGYSKEELQRSKEVLKKNKTRAPITRDGGRTYNTYEGEDSEQYQHNIDQMQEGIVKQLELEKNRQRLSPEKAQ
jgi:hypothetical protein